VCAAATELAVQSLQRILSMLNALDSFLWPKWENCVRSFRLLMSFDVSQEHVSESIQQNEFDTLFLQLMHSASRNGVQQILC